MSFRKARGKQTTLTSKDGYLSTSQPPSRPSSRSSETSDKYYEGFPDHDK